MSVEFSESVLRSLFNTCLNFVGGSGMILATAFGNFVAVASAAQPIP